MISVPTFPAFCSFLSLEQRYICNKNSPGFFVLCCAAIYLPVSNFAQKWNWIVLTKCSRPNDWRKKKNKKKVVFWYSLFLSSFLLTRVEKGTGSGNIPPNKEVAIREKLWKQTAPHTGRTKEMQCVDWYLLQFSYVGFGNRGCNKMNQSFCFISIRVEKIFFQF